MSPCPSAPDGTLVNKSRPNSFGHDRVVLGPVIGAFGEMSEVLN